METEGPIPERVEHDKPIGTFNDKSLNDVQKKLSTKYPTLQSILTRNPTITIENLATELGVSYGTAQAAKKQWNESTAESNKETGFKIPNLFGEGKGQGGKPLSAKEADELTEPFIAALQDNLGYVDEYLWNRQKAVGIDTHNAPIWSDIDEDEAQALTRVMMRAATRNATAAAVVHGVVESADYIAVGVIMIPRIQATVKVLRETRQPRIRRLVKREDGNENSH